MRDFAQVKADGRVTHQAADAALSMEGVDARGLDRLDRRFIQAIIEHYGGGPVGLEAIAATINDEAETLAELVEPYLLKIGFVVRGPSGRRATPAAYQHLGYRAGRTAAAGVLIEAESSIRAPLAPVDGEGGGREVTNDS